MKVNYGQSVHLSCPLRVTGSEEIATAAGLKWFWLRNERSTGVELPAHGAQRFAVTSDGGLVILGTTEREAGQYECRLGSSPLVRYELFVDMSKRLLIFMSSSRSPASH